MCRQHDTSEVVLFCDTCACLVCAKCVSYGSGSHGGHIYLDLQQAVLAKKEQLAAAKERVDIRLALQKQVRQEIHVRIQKLKLEGLRNRGLIGRRSKALQEIVKQKQRSMEKHIDDLLAPSLSCMEVRYEKQQEAVVRSEAALSSADSLLSVPEYRDRAFLKKFGQLHAEMEAILSSSDLHQVCDTSRGSMQQTDLLASGQLPSRLAPFTASFHKQRAAFRGIGTSTNIAPSAPHLLPELCTVGHGSAHLAWKCVGTEKPSYYLLYYRSLTNPNFGLDNLCENHISHEQLSQNFSCLKLRDVTYKNRKTGMIKNLSPKTLYHFRLYACNGNAIGNHVESYFTTPEAPSNGFIGTIMFTNKTKEYIRRLWWRQKLWFCNERVCLRVLVLWCVVVTTVLFLLFYSQHGDSFVLSRDQSEDTFCTECGG